MRFLSRSLVALLFAALSVTALAYAGYTVVQAFQARAEQDGARPGAGREREFTVRPLTVTPGRVTPRLSAYGEVRSRRTLELRAPIGGRVTHVAAGVEDGAQVREGQVLFRIDPADARSALELARNDLAQAEAELRDARSARDLAAEDVAAAQAQFDLRRRALDRREGLAERGVATEAQLEDAELALNSARQALVGRRQAQASAVARVDQARAALERARINVAEAERRLADTTVRAGITGTLADVTLVEGGQVNSNEQLARIIDPDALEVSVRVSTAQYLRLLGDDGALRGVRAQVALDVADAQVASGGRVVRASATVAQGQTGRALYVELDSPRGFRPGDFVTVTLDEPALDGVAALPATALTVGDEVLVIGPDNRLQARAVSVLRRQGDRVIVRADALAGTEIVRAIGPMLGSGIRVNPQRPDPDAQQDAQQSAAADGAMITLDPERRARLIAQVADDSAISDPARERLIAQLSQDQVPARTVESLENGG